MGDDRDPDDLDLRHPDDPGTDGPELEPGPPGEPTLLEVPRERFPLGLEPAVFRTRIRIVTSR